MTSVGIFLYPQGIEKQFAYHMGNNKLLFWKKGESNGTSKIRTNYNYDTFYAIGVLAMYRNHVPIVIWISNIACLVLMSFVSLIMITQKFNINRSEYKKFILPVALLLLILTFVNPGMESVHRWISIGTLKLNIAMIVLPIILIELWNVLKTKGLKGRIRHKYSPAQSTFFI
ncbi:hypothetical protein [Lacrimispora sp.]|uniref:hypothetical protein n=1 Tax=Lacrimispora sp. TaxID=2719234 RepID=UPI0028983C49|nr:hypothetical protein [Lacrimispora sp.]